MGRLIVHWVIKGVDVWFNRVLLCACAALIIVFASSEASSGRFDKDILEGTFHCSRPCVIKASRGGSILRFVNAAQELLDTQNLAIIDGYCASACTIFADKARSNVCITNRAIFLFHQATDVFSGEREDPSRYYSKVIAAWVNAHGGFPTQGLLAMRAQDAKAFWRLCNDVARESKADSLRVRNRHYSRAQ